MLSNYNFRDDVSEITFLNCKKQHEETPDSVWSFRDNDSEISIIMVPLLLAHKT